MIDSLSKQRY